MTKTGKLPPEVEEMTPERRQEIRQLAAEQKAEFMTAEAEALFDCEAALTEAEERIEKLETDLWKVSQL